MAQTPLPPIPNAISREAEGVPIDPNSVGQTERAVRHLGDQVAAMTLDIVENRKAQEDDDFATQAALKDERDLHMEMLTAQYETPADGTGYAERVKAFAKNRLQQQSDLAPSEDAKRLYYKRVTPLYSSAVVKAELHEAEARNAAFGVDFEQGVESTAKSVLDIPDHALAMSQWEKHEASLTKAVASRRITPLTSAKYDIAGRRKIGNGLADGYFNDGRYAEGLAFLEGTIAPGEVLKNEPGVDYVDLEPAQAAEQGFITQDEARDLESKGAKYRQPLSGSVEFSGLGFEGKSPFVQAMTEAEVDAHVKRFKKAMLVKTGEKVSGITARVEDTASHFYRGGGEEGAGANELMAEIRALPEKQMSAQAKIQNLETIMIARFNGMIMEGLRNTPRSQWPDLEEKRNEGLEQFRKQMIRDFPSEARYLNTTSYQDRRRAQGEAHWELAKRELIKEQNADAALYSLKQVPTLKSAFAQAQDWKSPRLSQDYAARSLSYQSRVGIEDKYRRILPIDVARRESAYMKSADNNDQMVSRRLTQLQNAFGKYYPRVLNEIAGKDDTIQKYLMTSHVAAQESRDQIVTTIRQGPEIDKAYKVLGRNKEDLDDALEKEAKDFNAAMIGASAGGGHAFINSMNKAVEIEAKRRVIENPELSDSEAVKGAWTTVIGFNYQKVAGGRSKVITPTVIPGMKTAMDQKMLEAFLVSHQEPEALKELGPKIFPGFARTYKQRGVPEAEWNERFLEALAKGSKWVNTQHFDGVRLVYEGPETGGKIQVTDGANNPISFTFNELMSGKFRTKDFMYKENRNSKSFMKKVFGD